VRVPALQSVAQAARRDREHRDRTDPARPGALACCPETPTAWALAGAPASIRLTVSRTTVVAYQVAVVFPRMGVTATTGTAR